MTRPTLVRADSIDLQEQNSPSAKDHSHHPADTGKPAPHQAEALREVWAEAAEEKSRSPRVSREWAVAETTNLHNQIASHDALAGINSSLNNHLKQQDGVTGIQKEDMTGSPEDGDMADVEGDDGMDDDMMDKISSSPSIDDGGYSFPSPPAHPVTDDDMELPPIRQEIPEQDLDYLSEEEYLDGEESPPRRKSWPPRTDSLLPSNSPPSSLLTGGRSSSPFIDTPVHYPLHFLPSQMDLDPMQSEHHHHLPGLYPEADYFENDDYDEDDLQECDDDELAVGERLREVSIESFREAPMQLPRDASIESYDDVFDLSDEAAVQLEQDIQSELIDNSFSSTRAEAQGLLIPYDSEDEDDDDDDDCPNVSHTEDSSRFIDSGWGGECLQELEDIDFEFVYALHTFIATVEGQANAQKGDTMVLLDDSNSYWWLVRVVKDGSIGYLPAEHIETPTERLARLNKHRNIDLSATMLGDQAEKSKNPLKKAIRRRNAKTVTFAAPTYVEASDNDYSTEEEDGESPFYSQEDQRAETQDREQEADDNVAVEPLRTREVKEVKTEIESNGASDAKTSYEDSNRASSDIFDTHSETSKSRNGTVRNTDSFFKDDSVETRKITITPALFRDDSTNSTDQISNESRDVKQRPSLEKLDKDSLTDKSKDDKKKKEKKDKREKEKKPGMLSGLFKRGKKGKGGLEDDVDVDELIMGKRSTENARTSPVPSSKDSQDSLRDEASSQMQAQAQAAAAAQQVQRQPSKLHKQPKQEASSPIKQSAAVTTEERRPTDVKQAPAPERPPPATSVQDPSMRLVQPEEDPSPEQQRGQQNNSAAILSSSPPQEMVKESKAGAAVSKIKSAISEQITERPPKTRKAKSRQALDDFDSSSEPESPVEEIRKDLSRSAPASAPSTAPLNITNAPTRQAPQRPIPGAFPDSYIGTPAETPAVEKQNVMEHERLSESPVQVSPVEASRSNPPPLMVDTSSQEEVPSPVSSPSPEFVEHRSGHAKKGTQDSASSSSTATWNDHHLRSFFDDEGEIRDLLTVVYDKSGVVPAGPDHPITGKMFTEENAKLAEITNRLDNMLGDWLARKMKNQGGR